MGEAKFNMDWEVHQRIERLAKEHLTCGLTPHEVRDLVLHSSEYKEWNSMERCFGVEYHELFIYTDLLGEIEFKEYDCKVKQIAQIEMEVSDKKLVVETKWKFEFDRLFHQIGIIITPVDLGRNIGLLSMKIGLKEPLGVLEFLGLITDNASALLYLEMKVVTTLEDKQNEIISFIEEFIQTYSDK